MKRTRGKVTLIGAGPGDPGLLTLKAEQALQDAEIIFYDNLVNPRILETAPVDAKKIDVGKRGEGSRADQREIEDKLVQAARRGKRVVRLKGGDPFIFGRGGEEAERLAAERIPFDVIPGVTSAIAAPAYAGIPLTHRDFTHTVAFVTGHSISLLDWNSLAKMGTLVFLMGVKTIDAISKNLIAAGKDPKTPLALIRWGSYPRQKTWISTLAKIPSVVKRDRIMPPAVIVLGEVVRLRGKIKWFERRPLFGKRVWVTRSRGQAGRLSEELTELGAEVVEIPTIEIAAPGSFKPLDLALKKIKNYRRIIFTSTNAVQFFFDRLKAFGMDLRELHSLKIVAIGPATARALRDLLLKVEAIPDEFHSEGLIKYFSKKKLKGEAVLFPRPKKGREELLHYLRSQGVKVTAPVVYENRIPPEAKLKIRNLSGKPLPDLITFTSSSTAENLFRLLRGPLKRRILRIAAVCIGPTTEKTARELGFRVVGVAKKSTIADLVKEIRGVLR